MKLREWWKGWPWDVRLGYAAFCSFVVWAAIFVDAGPDLLMWLSVFLVVPLTGVVALVIAARLVAGPPRRARVLPLALASGCLVAAVATPPGAEVDLHLIVRVYLAGGPDHVNEWGQTLIAQQPAEGDSRVVDRDQVPAGIRKHLSSHPTVGPTIWSDLPRVRMERGGGFYHYGVVVYPSGTAPPPRWWQRALGWPPEVVVYHED
jgi:hypothetical protein